MNYFFLELYRIRLRKCDFLVKLDLSVSRGNHIYYSTWAFSSTLFEFLLVSPVCKSVAMHLKVNTSPWLCLPFDSLLRVNRATASDGERPKVSWFLSSFPLCFVICLNWWTSIVCKCVNVQFSLFYFILMPALSSLCHASFLVSPH